MANNTHLYGDWSKIMPKIIAAQEVINEVGEKELMKVAKNYLKEIKEHIRRQDLELQPPLISTQKRKIAHKDEWWIETEKFISLLQIRKEKKKNEVSLYAGAMSDVKYKKQYSMYQIASWVEFGWSKAVARPLFGKTLEKIDMNEFSRKVGREVTLAWV